MSRRIASGIADQAPTTLGHWREDAACKGHPDPEAFFPDPSDRAAADYVIARVCAGCPVQRECLDEAKAIKPAHRIGIWGGVQLNLRTGCKRPPRDFTHAEMRAANAAYCRWKDGGGPELTDDQADAYRAYKRVVGRLRARRQVAS